MIKRTLYFGNPAYLSMKNAQMVLRLPGKDGEEEQIRTFPIEDLGVVILDHKQITITQGLMERLLVKHVMKNSDDPWELSPAIKRELLTIPTLDVKIDGKRRPLMIAAEMTTASLARCFTGESRKISYPYF